MWQVCIFVVGNTKLSVDRTMQRATTSPDKLVENNPASV